VLQSNFHFDFSLTPHWHKVNSVPPLTRLVTHIRFIATKVSPLTRLNHTTPLIKTAVEPRSGDSFVEMAE
jgi:hypothetical protein